MAQEKSANQDDAQTIFVGKKPKMNYAMAIVSQLNNGHNELKIVARGLMISKAVDVSQIVKNKLHTDLKIGSIEVGSEEIEDKEQGKFVVSTIEINVSK